MSAVWCDGQKLVCRYAAVRGLSTRWSLLHVNDVGLQVCLVNTHITPHVHQVCTLLIWNQSQHIGHRSDGGYLGQTSSPVLRSLFTCCCLRVVVYSLISINTANKKLKPRQTIAAGFLYAWTVQTDCSPSSWRQLRSIQLGLQTETRTLPKCRQIRVTFTR